MSEFGVCPLCGHNCFSDDCLHATADYIAEIERLNSELQEWKDYQQSCMMEPCIDHVHCMCVPGLRKEIERLNALWTAAEESCLHLRAEIESLRFQLSLEKDYE